METKLQTLLENDKDRVMAEFERDRTTPAVRTAMEKELDRLGFQYMESGEEDSSLEEASRMLSVIKNMVPILSSVNDVREWKKEAGTTAQRKWTPSAFLLLAAGLFLAVFGMLPLIQDLVSRAPGIPEIVFYLIPVSAAVCLFLAGYFQGRTSNGRKKRKTSAEAADRKLEFLADPDALWNSLHGVILLADRSLEDARSSRNYENEVNAEALGGKISPETVELLSELLESAYGKVMENPKDETSLGMISTIRYYLHRNQIETVDYSEKTAGWFEKLPGKYKGTLRPALASGNTLIRKGLASG